MAANPYQYHGVVKGGKVELEPGAGLAEGTQVIVTLTHDEAPKKCTGLDLLNSEIFGMWADRTDIPDSVEYVRELRERVWKRSG